MYIEKSLKDYTIYRNYLIYNDFNDIYSVYNFTTKLDNITEIIASNIIGLKNAKNYIDLLIKNL